MKIAIVHDWLVTNGGAEKVLKSIIGLYPKANVYSLVDFLDDKDRNVILNGRMANVSFIQKLPFAKKYFRNYLPFFQNAIESFDLSDYDLIISSSWAVAKGVKKTERQIHICYCHTPVRYAWDLYDEYTSNLSTIKKVLVKWSLKRLKKWDIETLGRVDYFVANSNFVKDRIKRIYNRDSEVIYPPVDIKNFSLNVKKEKYFLTASRLVPYKKTKLIIEAFNEMPNYNLVVIGDGEELESIKKIAKKNVKILGYCENDVLKKYMQNATGFIYAAIEDFGIIPIEAMACGTPVIALNKGGTKETVTDFVNGIHFENQKIEDVKSSIEKFYKFSFDPITIRETTKIYTEFDIKFKDFVNKKCKKL